MKPPAFLDFGAMEQLVSHAKTAPLSQEECSMLKNLIGKMRTLVLELEKKKRSIERLRNLVFGASTETKDILFPESQEADMERPFVNS